jgi:hypothetical protein
MGWSAFTSSDKVKVKASSKINIEITVGSGLATRNLGMIKIIVNERTTTNYSIVSSGSDWKSCKKIFRSLRDRLRFSIDSFSPNTRGIKKRLLVNKWKDLPSELQTDNQILGRHWVGCGYTMGPSYCSFGCSHCYLPKASNRVPLVSLESMKEQIIAQRELLGPGGNLQITGGDVVDAYWRAGKREELIEVLKFATDNKLVPMLMTHGQLLLENPDYFAQLVLQGGLRKLSIHIDITMAGRPGMPVKSLSSETQLNPLRDEFVELILEVRKRTGKFVVAAQTVTVTEKNIHSIGEILVWLMSSAKNLNVCRTVSFQPEANVGRTRIANNLITPEQVWSEICKSTGKDLARDHLLVGHPECSSIATLLINARSKQVVDLSSKVGFGSQFWRALLNTFGGIGASSVSPLYSLIQKIVALIKRPAIVPFAFLYAIDLHRRRLVTKHFLWSLFFGRIQGLNIVMHNFISQQDLEEPRSNTIQRRIKACAFKGVIKIDNEWEAISMCEMNVNIRPKIYGNIRVKIR